MHAEPLRDLPLRQPFHAVEQERLTRFGGQLQQGLVKNHQALARQQRRLRCRRATGHVCHALAVVVARGEALITTQGIDRNVSRHAKNEAARVQHRHAVRIDLRKPQVSFVGNVRSALAVTHAPCQKLQQVVIVFLETCQQARHVRRQHG